MAMPKNITLANKSGNTVKLDFDHALRLLRLGVKNGTNSFSVKGKYTFNGNDIIRRASDKNSQGQAE
jgi:hypothetical protein